MGLLRRRTPRHAKKIRRPWLRRLHRQTLVPANVGRHDRHGLVSDVGAESLSNIAPPLGHGAVDVGAEHHALRALAAANALLGAAHRPHATPGGSGVRDRPLALRHDAPARVAGVGRAAHLSEHLRLFLPEPLPAHGPVFRPLLKRIAAQAAADGQHGSGVGLPPRRRIRAVQHGPAVALLDDRLSQPPATKPGVFRARGRVAAAAGALAKTD